MGDETVHGDVHCIAHPTARGYIVLAECVDRRGERSRIGWWCTTKPDAEVVLRSVRRALLDANESVVTLMREVNRPPFVLARGALPAVKQSGIVARTDRVGSEIEERSRSK